jgi:hypothetical protein
VNRWLLILSMLAITPAALGDDVFLKNGQVIYGEVQETPEAYRIKVEHGAITIEKKRVLRIEKKISAMEVYRSRAEKMGEGTADDHYRLATWCEARNLPRTARKEYHRAIRKDPDHVGARTALGYLRIDGKWMTREEHLLSRGYVHDGKRWISPADQRREEPEPPPAPQPPEARIQIDVHVGYGPGYGAVYTYGGRRRGHRPGGPYIMYSPTLIVPANPYNRLIPDGRPGRVRPRPAGVPTTPAPGRPARARVGPPAGIP